MESFLSSCFSVCASMEHTVNIEKFNKGSMEHSLNAFTSLTLVIGLVYFGARYFYPVIKGSKMILFSSIFVVFIFGCAITLSPVSKLELFMGMYTSFFVLAFMFIDFANEKVERSKLELNKENAKLKEEIDLLKASAISAQLSEVDVKDK